MRKIFLDPIADKAFKQKGYVVLDLLSEQDVAKLMGFYKEYRGLHEDGFCASVLTDDLAARNKIHETVGSCFEERLLPVLHDYQIVIGSYAVKEPDNDYSKVHLHQDLSFVDESTGTGISLWCPLVDVNDENGCLRVLPGSHLVNSVYREPCSLPYEDLADLIDKHYLVSLPMKAGQALFMDNRLFHASESNHGKQARVIAAGIATPRESPILYCHRDLDGNQDVLEIYEVPHEFFVSHKIGTRPGTGKHTKTVQHVTKEFTKRDLDALWASMSR